MGVLPAALISKIRDSLAARGWCFLPTQLQEATDNELLELARALGRVYVPPGASPEHPFIKTQPAADADDYAPFDQPEAIGWHNDFSTHRARPAVSIAWLTRADPFGQGAWRIASCDDVLARLRATPEGAETCHLLAEAELPFCFTREDPEPTFFRVIEPRERPSRRFGMRFYGRALRFGARRVHGFVPAPLERAFTLVEAAADQVGHTLHAPSGALLISDNWHALHDRLAQTTEAAHSLRRSCLCFVETLHEP